LLLAPSFDEKTWGGRRLESLGKHLPPGKIGESLESGPDAVVDGGPFAGAKLATLARTHARALLGQRGHRAAKPFDDFPLLIKLIDAHEDLSVQVHPDDAHAPAGKRGKTEAWYILDAAPGATIVSGVRGSISIDEIESQLIQTVVSPGDVFFVPAGTVHAIGAGVLLYEIQQASDVTWRLYDWGRLREIHVEAALTTARSELVATQIQPLRIDSTSEVLVACRYFALERRVLADGDVVAAYPASFRVVTVLDGEARIGDVHLRLGSSAVLPADLPDLPVHGSGTVLLGYIPDLELDIRQPLLAAGHDPASIECLGSDL
jgi:mannose-6-phosphate isomerase